VADDGAELEALLSERTIAHRANTGDPMTTLDQLRAWLDGRGIALVSGHSAVPNAAEAIAGQAIQGSWWGHACGGAIYRFLTELEDDENWLDVALIESKHTLVSSSLTPAVVELAADAERRNRVVAKLPTGALRLWEVVSEGEGVNSDDPRFSGKSWRAARRALEVGLLARSRSEHTDSGHHVAWVEMFGDQPTIGDGNALGRVLRACLSSAVVAERREVVRWLRAVEPDTAVLEAAVDSLGTRTLVVDSRTWLTGEV
jgi:hypothetical protein